MMVRGCRRTMSTDPSHFFMDAQLENRLGSALVAVYDCSHLAYLPTVISKVSSANSGRLGRSSQRCSDIVERD